MKRSKKILLDHPELELPETRKLWQTEGLFSEHYLKSRVQGNDWWPSDDAVRPIWQYCVDLFNRRYVPCAQNNEAFTRQELINPILAKLGFAWTDNLSLPDQDAEPDYILFADAAEKEKVIAESREKRYRVASALLEAKKVNHPLSQISKHQQRYPHQQIRDYLQEAQVLGWGILTNGNEWRLYCRDAKPSHFFCISFPLAIQSLENFKYFVSLFSPAAFVRNAAGKCRLDAIRESGIAAQTELETDLRQRVFTLVEILANGFVERPDNAIPDNPDGHRLLYENCLILLYRLLFILYAEGRLLLPVEPKSRKYYKDISLARLVGPLKGFIEFDSHTRTRLYEDIVELCRLINGTDEAKNKEYSVPRYNGGLFDPNRFPQLERWRICDAKLAEVLRGLMFAKPERHNRELPLETMDYADLRVQQLGSIYEGLLEYHFVRNAAGHLELQTDKAERKATGTYYTPDYIVSYIVEHTLGPLVADIEQRPEVKQGNENAFADAMLSFNICDPAMGSGHFLVEATAWLAEQIVYHPTTRFQAEFRRGEDQDRAEIAYWRRRVVEACIYGVDLNPLAVELAKLSLWLTTIAGDQPLNFLDHHLRCGNSLIGARLDDLGKLPERKKKGGPGAPRTAEQITFTFGPDFKKAAAAAIRQIQQIEGEASATVAKVKDKEKLWGEISESLAPYKAVADLWTSTFFGRPLDEETYIATAQKLLVSPGGQGSVVTAWGRTDATERVPPAEPWRETAAVRHFFHWELEFPEVFFAPDGTPKPNPGFDAVIGNPPYGLISSEEDKAWAQGLFAATQYQPDNYVTFIEQTHRLSRVQGGQSLIVPTTFLTMHYFSSIRHYLLEHCRITTLIHFRYPVFADPTVESAVYLCVTEPNAAIRRGNPVCTIVANSQDEFELDRSASEIIAQERFEEMHEYDFNFSLAGASGLIAEKIQKAKVLPLGSLCEITVGVKPYQTGKGKPKQTKETVENRVFDASSRKDGTYHQYLMGRDIGRFFVAPLEERWISYGEWLAEPRSEAPFFVPKRILVRQTGDSIIAAIETEKRLTLNNLHNLKIRNQLSTYEYLLAILNSQLMTYYHQKVVPEVGRVFAEVKIVDLERLPILQIAFTTPAAERKRLAKKGPELYESAVKKNDAAVVLRFAEQQFAADHSDVVHDLLAFLAERMMELNREKRDAARQFLTDLEDFHGIDAHALTPKTKLDQFWRLGTSDFFAHLRANAKRLAEQDIRIKDSDEDKLRKRFESAQKKIVPLGAEIAFTDTLIDQIVYRLYGLTEAEIKIVEETVN